MKYEKAKAEIVEFNHDVFMTSSGSDVAYVTIGGQTYRLTCSDVNGRNPYYCHSVSAVNVKDEATTSIFSFECDAYSCPSVRP